MPSLYPTRQSTGKAAAMWSSSGTKTSSDREDTPKVFHVRSVRVGVKTDRYTEIVAGVWPGEIVATQGSDALRAELLKGNLGEGCAEGG